MRTRTHTNISGGGIIDGQEANEHVVGNRCRFRGLGGPGCHRCRDSAVVAASCPSPASCVRGVCEHDQGVQEHVHVSARDQADKLHL